MTREIKARSIRMFHPNLKASPSFALPSEFRLDWYEHGDATRWIGLQREVECRLPITQELYTHDFGTDDRVLAERQCFLIDGQRLIGTATAWSSDLRGEELGRVHWVAIHPDYQGQGLSKPLLSAVCDRLLRLGHDQAFLVTSGERIPAINLYLRFGFVPLLRKVRDESVWREIETRLDVPVVDRAVVHSPILRAKHLLF